MNEMTGMQAFLTIIGFISPFVSVQAASMLAQRREARAEAMKLFTKIHQEIQEFRLSLQELHYHSRTWPNMLPGDKQDEIMRLAAEENRKSHGLVSILLSDCLASRLLFGSSSAGLEQSVRELVKVAAIRPGTILDDGLHSLLSPLLEAVESEITAMWKEFGSWKATNWN